MSRTVCPYAGHAHSSNNMSLVYNHERHRVSVHCLKAECALKACGVPRVSWPIAFAEEDAEAMVAGSGYAHTTLHACQHMVVHKPGDEYCEDKMQPFPPTDRFVAVRVGMGVGEVWLDPGGMGRACDSVSALPPAPLSHPLEETHTPRECSNGFSP
jgi:hypothetical protein